MDSARQPFILSIQCFLLRRALFAGGCAGVIWNGIQFETLVIPAKAGIHPVGGAFPMACGVDSRFRGNDCTWECPRLANDTSSQAAVVAQFGVAPTPQGRVGVLWQCRAKESKTLKCCTHSLS